jgi:hypothetical protein
MVSPFHRLGVIERVFAWGIVVSLAAALSGCGGGKRQPNAREQATISGSVKNGDNPIDLDSSIVFINETAGANAAGKIDSLGNYSLTAADPSIGIPAGRYKVVIRPPEKPAVKAVDSDAYKEMMMKGKPAVKEAAPAEGSSIPAKLQGVGTTSLVFEVKPGPNTFDIDLSKFAN